MILVPIESDNISNLVTELPHSINNSSIIEVSLKRKLDMKNTVFSTFVNVKHLKEALDIFKILKNPHFSNIRYNDKCNRERQVNVQTETQTFEEENISASNTNDLPSTNECDDILLDDAISSFQFKIPDDVVMIDEYPETTEKVTKIAPGENQHPIPYYNDENWDTKAFPHLFPSGTLN